MKKQYNYSLDFIKGLACIFVVLFQCLKYKGTLKHKCWFFRNANNARKHGVIYFRIKRVATEFTDALREKTEMSLEEKNGIVNEVFILIGNIEWELRMKTIPNTFRILSFITRRRMLIRHSKTCTMTN